MADNEMKRTDSTLFPGTDQPRADSGDVQHDAEMERRLKAAYDQMGPNPQAEARMLAALKAAAQADAGAKEAASTKQAAGAKEAAGGLSAEKAPRRRVAPWKVALPVAACLAMAAIGVGVVASQQPSALQETANVAAPEASASTANSAKRDQMATASDEETLGYAYSGEVDSMAAGSYAPADAYRPMNTEEYGSVDETGFVSTATSPLSTVSADVDTASYCNLRRMLKQGYTLQDVPAGAVRIEEMLNYFRYQYAAPEGDNRFGMQARVGQCPWNPDTQLMVLGFSTAQEVQDKPANLVFLIDVSGSMDSPDKLDLLQDSFATLLEHLDGNDRVSIVTYSGQEEVVLEGAKGDADKEILRAIYRLNASGSTNGEAGLRMAYDVAERNRIEGGVNRIVMASDGDLNVGMTSESDLHDFVDQKRQSGIYLSVLGFGTGNYKDNKMETLADHGNGQYHYIDCIEEAERVLSDNLMSGIVPFADDVKVQVEFNPAQVKGYRLIGYENRAMANEDFLDDTADAGDIGPNAQFTVAYEVVPVDSAMEIAVPDLKYSQAPAAGGDEWLTCSLRYRAFDDGQVHQQEMSVAGQEGIDADWKLAASVIELGMLARGSEYAGSSTVLTAMGLLDSAIEGKGANAELEGYRELLQKASENSGAGRIEVIEDVS